MDKKMRTRIIKAMNQTWQAIGGDTLTAMQEVMDRDYVTRDEVIEVVLDRVHELGQDKEATIELNSLPYEAREEIAKEAFPFRTYEW